MARLTEFTYTVTVVSSGGNKYAINGNTQQYVTLFPGSTYKFDQADSTNGGHPLRFSETDNGTHASGSEYTTGVTTAGTPGSSGAYTQIEVTGSTPYRLYYYCTQHSGMGGLVNVPPNFVTGSASPGANTTSMEQITIASQGNSANFGNISANGENSSRAGGSNAVRGLTMGSFNSYPSKVPDTFATDDILFYSLASEGNTADFGNLTYACYGSATCTGSSTRMIHCGGSYYGGSPQTTRARNIIDYMTIASTGNATDFGDLSTARDVRATISNGVRSVMGGGQNAPADQGAVSATKENIMEYVTIASTGNTTDFGDLTVARSQNGGTSSSTRGVYIGGRAPNASNIIDYITIASTGDATDYGDLVTARIDGGSAGNGHGGLQ